MGFLSKLCSVEPAHFVTGNTARSSADGFSLQFCNVSSERLHAVLDAVHKGATFFSPGRWFVQGVVDLFTDDAGFTAREEVIKLSRLTRSLQSSAITSVTTL